MSSGGDTLIQQIMEEAARCSHQLSLPGGAGGHRPASWLGWAIELGGEREAARCARRGLDGSHTSGGGESNDGAARGAAGAAATPAGKAEAPSTLGQDRTR